MHWANNFANHFVVVDGYSSKMTYHIVLRSFFIDVLRVVPFVLHHEPSNERDLEPLPAYSALTRIFRQYVYPNIPLFSIVYHRSVYDCLFFVD